MSTKQITGLVSNTDGSTAVFSGTIVVSEPPIVQSVTVLPALAGAGVPRSITIVASDPNGEALNYQCSVDGVALAPTATPGVFVWGG